MYMNPVTYMYVGYRLLMPSVWQSLIKKSTNNIYTFKFNKLKREKEQAQNCSLIQKEKQKIKQNCGSFYMNPSRMGKRGSISKSK